MTPDRRRATQSSRSFLLLALALARTDSPLELSAKRTDLRKIDVPVLVVKGDADQAVPFDKTGKRVPAFVKDVELVTISGGPHAIPWTHAEQVNTALLQFIGAHAAAPAGTRGM
jgi:pimeloyl-ACP methyl ester carboxylesterase